MWFSWQRPADRDLQAEEKMWSSWQGNRYNNQLTGAVTRQWFIRSVINKDDMGGAGWLMQWAAIRWLEEVVRWLGGRLRTDTRSTHLTVVDIILRLLTSFYLHDNRRVGRRCGLIICLCTGAGRWRQRDGPRRLSGNTRAGARENYFSTYFYHSTELSRLL